MTTAPDMSVILMGIAGTIGRIAIAVATIWVFVATSIQQRRLWELGQRSGLSSLAERLGHKSEWETFSSAGGRDQRER